MNENDAERLRRLLVDSGLKEVRQEKQADIIIAVLCSVKQPAIDRIWGKLKIWKNLNPPAGGPKILLTGCITKTDEKKFADRVDLIFNILDTKKLLNFLAKEKIIQKNFAKIKLDFFEIKPLRSKIDRAYIALGTGCDNFCTYCVVPYTRGREFSRSFEEIEKEFTEAIKSGVKTITLIAQNVNNFKLDKRNREFLMKKYLEDLRTPTPSCSADMVRGEKHYKKESDFVLLLRFLNDRAGDLSASWRIEFLTSHPKNMGLDLIKAIAKLDKVSKWIHLPVQSGDTKILKKMNRYYTRSQYINLVKKIRKYIPNVFLTTDIIVGFPNESKKQFENTVSLVKICQFDQAFISRFSPRPDTAAYKLKDNVPNEEKKRRFRILDNLINKKRNPKNNPWEIAESAN